MPTRPVVAALAVAVQGRRAVLTMHDQPRYEILLDDEPAEWAGHTSIALIATVGLLYAQPVETWVDPTATLEQHFARNPWIAGTANLSVDTVPPA